MIADEIANRYGNDGMVMSRIVTEDDDPRLLQIAEDWWEEELRVWIDAECHLYSVRRIRHDTGHYQFVFSDGSAITFHGDAWDIG